MQLSLEVVYQQYYRSLSHVGRPAPSTSIVLSKHTVEAILPQCGEVDHSSYGMLVGVRTVISAYVPFGFAIWREGEERVKVLDLRGTQKIP